MVNKNNISDIVTLVGSSLHDYKDFVEYAEESKIHFLFKRVKELQKILLEKIIQGVCNVLNRLDISVELSLENLLNIIEKTIRHLYEEDIEFREYLSELSRSIKQRDLLELAVQELQHILFRPHEVEIELKRKSIRLSEFLESVYFRISEYTLIVDKVMLVLSKFYIIYSLLLEYFDKLTNVRDLLDRLVLCELVLVTLKTMNKRIIERILEQLYNYLDDIHVNLVTNYVLCC